MYSDGGKWVGEGSTNRLGMEGLEVGGQDSFYETIEMEEAERFECFSVPVPEKKSFNLIILNSLLPTTPLDHTGHAQLPSYTSIP